MYTFESDKNLKWLDTKRVLFSKAMIAGNLWYYLGHSNRSFYIVHNFEKLVLS